jgi:DNA-binding response OmpR family regulator
MFVKNAGMVLSREKILNSIWGYDFFGDTRAVDTHVSRLRQKLHKSGANFNIATVYGVGYRLDED